VGFRSMLTGGLISIVVDCEASLINVAVLEGFGSM